MCGSYVQSTIIGVLVRPAMCIIPVSIVTTASRRVTKVVTRAGHASIDLLSGNIACGSSRCICV